MMDAETLKERRPNMAGAWTTSEYERLFRDYPGGVLRAEK